MGNIPGDPLSVSLNASYHNEQQYMWFRDGILNGFWDIKPYMNWRGWGIPPGNPSRCHTLYLIIRNKNIYGLGVGIWTVSEILGLLGGKEVWDQNIPSSGYWELVCTKFGHISAYPRGTLQVCYFEFWNPIANFISQYIRTIHPVIT